MKICLINFDAAWKDKQKNLEKKEELIEKALEKQPDTSLIVFPEMSLTGYILDKDIYNLAEDVDGPSIQAVKALAVKHSVNLIFGFIEKN